MELNHDNTIIRSGFSSQTEWKYDIDSKNKGIILHILRNQLYSDKIRAVLREYGTNALDAHISAKNEEPFHVTLPTVSSPQLHIRDFGKGLSPAQVEKTYIKLGKSTKRSSNLLNGCLGLGSKSGFAYSDTFQIVSHFGGQKNTYLAYIDETREGRLNKVQEDVTTETGIEIIIPCDEADIEKFRNTAASVFGVFDRPPHMLLPNGKEDAFQFKLFSEYFSINAPNKKGVYILPPHKSSRAIMGNVGYPIDVNLLKLPSTIRPVKYNISCPTGSIDFTASREALEYTERTITTLRNAIVETHEQFEAKLHAKLNSMEDWWKMKKYLNAVANGKKSILPNQPNAQLLIKKEYIWKGEIVNFKVPTCEEFRAYQVINKGKGIEWFQTNAAVKPLEKIFYVTMDTKKAVEKLRYKLAKVEKYRITNFLFRKILLATDNKNRGIFIMLNKEDSAEIKQFKQTFSPSNTFELELPSIVKRTRAIITADLKTHMGYPLSERWKQRKAVNLQTVEPGIFFNTTYLSRNYDISSLTSLYNKARLKDVGNRQLFIIKEDSLNLPGWISFSQYLSQTLLKDINTHLVQQLCEIAQSTGSWGILSNLKKFTGDYIIESIKEIEDLTKVYSEFRENLNSRQFAYYLEDSLTKHPKSQLILLQRYPMLQFVSGYTYQDRVVQAYINNMDALHSKPLQVSKDSCSTLVSYAP